MNIIKEQLGRDMLDSQRYPLNLHLINNVEDNVVFLAWKHCCESDMPLYKKRVTWNYVYSPTAGFKRSILSFIVFSFKF